MDYKRDDIPLALSFSDLNDTIPKHNKTFMYLNLFYIKYTVVLITTNMNMYQKELYNAIPKHSETFMYLTFFYIKYIVAGT